MFRAAQSLDPRDPTTQLANSDPVPAAMGPVWSHNGPYIFEGPVYKKSSLVLVVLTFLPVAPHLETFCPFPTCGDSL